MKTVITVTKGAALAMMLSATTISSAQALTVYTAGPGSLAKSLASGYEKKTGVKVNIFQATTGKVMARLEAEQANPQADVLISASWDTAEDLHHRGWLLPYQSANADKVPANLKSADYVAQGISALGIVWNTKAALRSRRVARPDRSGVQRQSDDAGPGAFRRVAGFADRVTEWHGR